MAQAQKPRIVFMGTPEFAAVSLQKLAVWPHGEVVGVYTQPDRPAGRGHKPAMSAVKKLGLALGLPVFQPASLKGADAMAELAALEPDFLVVAAYGLILPDAVLAIPRCDALNVHASVLPALRGAAPIQRAVMEGWQPGALAGVSIMRVVSKLDAGPVFAAESIPINEHTAGSLQDALAVLGADLLVVVLEKILHGAVHPVDQDENLATYAAKMGKEDGVIDWSLPAVQVHAQIRGVTPWPGARTVLDFSAGGAHAGVELSVIVSPGTIGEPQYGVVAGSVRNAADGLSVACADAWYVLSLLRPQGRNTMSAKDIINGMLRGLEKGVCGRAKRGS